MTTMTPQATTASVDLGHDFVAPSIPKPRLPWLLLADLAGVAVAMGIVGLAQVTLGLHLTTAVTVTWLLILFVTQPSSLTMPTVGQQARVVVRAGFVVATVCWLAPMVTPVSTSAPDLALVVGSLVGSALVTRSAAVLLYSRSHVNRVLVVGEADGVRRVTTELGRSEHRTWDVVAACVPDRETAQDLDCRAVAGTDPHHVLNAANAFGANTVVALPSAHLAPESLRRLTWELESHGSSLYVGTGLLDVAAERAVPTQVGTLGLLRVEQAPRHTSLPRMAKYLTEQLATVLLVLLISPILAAIALAVRLDSAGPAIFKQVRVGRDGRLFTMYKFRTMRIDAEEIKAALAEQNESDGVLFKMRTDPRITRVGEVLRKFSLDELPQLFNVVLGQMSLVGPRPALPVEVSQYDVDPRRRLIAKPGLTGLWQVSGRSDLSWEDSVRLDLHYVDNWSLALDASIMVRTVRAVLGHRGAY